MELVWAYCPSCTRWFYSPAAAGDDGAAAPRCPVCTTEASALSADADTSTEAVRG